MKKLNKNYLIFIILGVDIVSMKTYPTLLTQYGERDTWIAIAIASALLLLISILPIRVFQNADDNDLKSIYTRSLGRPLGNFFVFLFAFTLFLTLLECASVDPNLLHINILLDTPQWYFLIFLVVPAIYTLSKGENSILAVTLIGIAFILVSGTNLSILLFPYRKVEYILPILKNGLSTNLIICIIKSLGMYSGLAIVYPLIHKVSDKKKLGMPIIIAILILSEIQIFAATGLNMSFAAKRLNTIYYPRLIQTQIINYFNFIESGELYVLFQVIGGWFIKYTLTFYSLLTLLKQLNIKNKYTLYVISAIVFIIAFFLSQNTVVLFNLLDYYIYISLANFIIIPCIVFSIYIARNKKRLRHEKKHINHKK